VNLEDGTPLRVSFDSHNGYAFSSIERVLIDRNIIPRKEISTQSIRDWMAAHPEEAAKVRAANRSYVFFHITGLANEGEPVGAQGVPLTPGRSIAVDPAHQYGTPFFIEADLPFEGRKSILPFRRLMIAQDTGSAIVGPARADLYWGAGEEAGRIAGRIRHPGRFVMLLPRDLDLVAAVREVPLPAPKRKIAALEVGKHAGNGKVEVGGTDGRGKAESAGNGTAAAGKKIPSQLPEPKIAASEVAKQDSKGKGKSVGTPAAAAGRKTLSPPNTKIAALEAGRKQDGKGKANSTGASARGKSIVPVLKPKSSSIDGKKQDGRGKAESAGASGIAAGSKQKPSLASKSKTPEIEARKQDAKGKVETVGASSSAIAAAGKQKPSPAPKSKTSETEVKKQSGKGKAEAAGEDGRAAARSSRQAAPTRKSDRS
jgi:3D (Asp-Asp-Asp) domain-containing protein